MTPSAARAVGALAALTVLAGCASSTPAVGPSPTTMPTPPTALTSFYQQKLDWQKCGVDLCATLTVPLDYAHPGSATIKLAVLKVDATDQAHKLGALVVNPGGPGASGVQFAAAGAQGYFRKALTSRYDIVGFDPRGVGKSTAVNCGNTDQTDQVVAENPDPTTAAEWERANAITQAYLMRCQTLSGALAGHVSTVEAAHDMDVLRAALHQPKLDYFGVSYGTFLGATYANLFPGNVGRMVLDGAMDPALSTLQMTLQQARGFEVALRSYVDDCVRQSACPLGSTDEAAVARVQQFLAQAQAHPIPTGTPRELNESLAMYGIWAPLYVKANWPQLTDAFREVFTKDTARQFLDLADAYIGRDDHGYLDNSLAAQNAVNCLDRDDYTPWQQVGSLTPEFVKASPTFGRAFAAMLASCEFYPVQTHNRPAPVHAVGAAPIVVIGTTRDPATPIEWARALAQQLTSGVLVTRNGDGHTAYHTGNACIDDAVENYLVRGVVPHNGMAC